MKTGIVIALSTLIAHFPALVLAQSIQEAQVVDAEKPYEVVITGRVTKSRLRNLIIEVEDDWFQRFNELNTDDHYDISCYEYIPTMSHIRKRVCEPQFMMEARNSNSSEVASRLASGRNALFIGSFLEHTKTLRDEKHFDYKTLQEKMEIFLDTDKEFSEIGSVLTQLKSQLENYNGDD